MQLLFHSFCLMESWSYGFDAKGFVLSEEIVSPTDVLARSKKVLMGWDLKTPCNYDNTIDNQGFMELSFPDITRKPLPENPIGGFWGSKISNGRMAVGAEDSVLDSNGRDSSLIDLKLGRLADYRDAQNGEPIKEIQVMSSSVVSPMRTKRARTMSLNSQAPLCQVHGCNIDLSSSKDYHKRHKVCEIHSKTAKVIVNGIEQRFCQQCSRFHLLAEFDDGKRSCRKRLAGHNERRRKPQLDSHIGKNGKFLSSYHGIRFLGTSFPTRTPFICPDIYPSGIPNPVKCETSNWGNCVKLEDGAVYSPQSEIPISNRHLLPKSFLPPFDVEKQYPSLHSNSIDTSSRNIFYENKSQYPHDLAGSNSISRLHFRNTSSGNEDFTDFNATSIIQGSSRVSDSVCALSLLSSQSQHSSSQSSGIPMSQNLIPQGGHAHYSVGQFSEKLLGVSSQGSTSVASNRFSSSGMNSVEVDHLGPVLVSDASDVVDFELHTDGIFQGSNIINDKDPLSHEHEPTIDLLQLSSQLQHVERRRHSMQLKQENDVFCYLPIT